MDCFPSVHYPGCTRTHDCTALLELCCYLPVPYPRNTDGEYVSIIFVHFVCCACELKSATYDNPQVCPHLPFPPDTPEQDAIYSGVAFGLVLFTSFIPTAVYAAQFQAFGTSSSNDEINQNLINTATGISGTLAVRLHALPLNGLLWMQLCLECIQS